MTAGRLKKPRKRVYDFDASISVEALSVKDAVRKILRNATDGDVAVSLFDAGYLSQRKRASSGR